MIYTERKNLAILKLSEVQNTLSYEDVIQALIEHPSLAVYVEVKGLLYGMITLGRIRRSHRNHLERVGINTDFTFLGPNEYMKAREIFLKVNTPNAGVEKAIHVLPVVDSNGRLLGNYTIGNDSPAKEHLLPLIANLNTDEFIKCGFRLALVQPSGASQEKFRLFTGLKELLTKKGILTETMDFPHILSRYNSFDYVVFWDETERTTAEIIREINDKNRQTAFIVYENLTYALLCDVQRILELLQDKGAFIFTFDFEENESGYLGIFEQKIENRRKKNGWPLSSKLMPEAKQEFFSDLYESFGNQNLPLPLSFCMKDGVICVHDINTPFVRVEHGRRRTVGQPAKYERSIHIAGPCITVGAYTDDQHTISSLLQERINCEGLKCKVENCGVLGSNIGMNGGGAIGLCLNRLLATPINQGDIIVFYKQGETLSGIQNLNLTDVLERYQIPVDWFVNTVWHCNHKANQVFTEAIFEMLLPVLRHPPENRQPIEMDRNPVRQLYLNQHFTGFNISEYKKIGSIVMNCNPFTFGHRYLIEEALKQVDFLIVFVVEDDMSLFSFLERFSMVCDGIADLKNVMVVPSGGFILSRLTFPEYFIKETDEEMKENTENDITLFAERIAPVLGITHRFVGEEPEDPVTNTYNQAMKKILPAYGIQLVEIPRKQDKQTVISASRVRKCLEENDMEGLNALVPESTKKILFYADE